MFSKSQYIETTKNDTENYFNNEATEVLKKNILAPLLTHKSRQQ